MKLALSLALWAAPALALACPVCARDAGPHVALFVGGLIAAPYGVAWWAVRAIRRTGS